MYLTALFYWSIPIVPHHLNNVDFTFVFQLKNSCVMLDSNIFSVLISSVTSRWVASFQTWKVITRGIRRRKKSRVESTSFEFCFSSSLPADRNQGSHSQKGSQTLWYRFAASPSLDTVFRNGSQNDLLFSCAEWERIKHQDSNQLAKLWDVEANSAVAIANIRCGLLHTQHS